MEQSTPYNEIQTLPFTFLGLAEQESSLALSRTVIIPVAYDSTTSYKSGAREGPAAIINASRYMEDYDIELQREPSASGIHTYPQLEARVNSPESMIQQVQTVVQAHALMGKLVVTLGGDHSISIGAVAAHKSLFKDISVLYFDAHADLRDHYQGSSYGHASTAKRIHEQVNQLVQVGIRSMSSEESDFIEERHIPSFMWNSPSKIADSEYPEGYPPFRDLPLSKRLEAITSRLSTHVYISIDLDVFDPSEMPSVGTPEPGGLRWRDLIDMLHGVSQQKTIIGFDLVELSPEQGPNFASYTAARLVYTLIGYALQSQDDATNIAMED
jgi:agmatinase